MTEPPPDGYLFQSRPDENLIVQARLDGFTLSRLQPYHDGDKFVSQARELWDRYRELARPLRVTRLAIRNINRIEMDPGLEEAFLPKVSDVVAKARELYRY